MVILHLSDLHLDKKTEGDTISYTIEPLVKCLVSFMEKNKKIDIVVFSGDLVDKGGLSYDGDASVAFYTFYEIFISNILSALSLPESRFFMVPGNHDIVRSADSSIMEKGLQTHLSAEDIVNEFINNSVTNSDLNGLNRIKAYKEFESLLYNECIDKTLTNFASNFKIKIEDRTIGVTCFNSSWRCYDSDNDKGKLLIGDYQINQSTNYLKDCDIKIAISHHSLDQLAEFDKNIVDARLQMLYDIHLTGHVHKADADYRIHPYGKLYRSVASGTLSNSIRTSSNEYHNGFSIIDFDDNNKQITTYFYRYENLKNEFVPNNTLGDNNGMFETNMLNEHELTTATSKNHVIRNIINDNLTKLNSHLITYQTDTTAPKTIDELFVMPIIEYSINLDPNKEPKLVKDIQYLLDSKHNYVVFGTKESGKTILLDKLLIEKLKQKKIDTSVPVYIDFSDSRSDILLEVKNFMGVNREVAVKLLEQYGVLFLIDNLSFDSDNKYKLRNLSELLRKYPKSRIICTHHQLYKSEFPIESELSRSFDYERLVIKDLKAKQIKSLIKLWFSDNNKYEAPKKLQTLVDAFQALTLPRTPFSVSMFLWIIEKQENTRPINNSTLIENFIEKLLDKQNKKEILSERFDFKNQIRLLADIAHYMYEKNNENYKITFVELSQFIESYLSLRDFHMSTVSIMNQLLVSGLFSQDFTEKDYVKFRFTCFFEFFLVKKMEATPSFKKEVLSEDKYLQFINEIDYFTGLHREETEILELIISRLSSVYEDLNALLPNSAKSTDELFNTKESVVSKIDQNRVMKYLPLNKPTEEDLDINEDRKLEIEEEREIKKKEAENNYKDLSKVLVLAMRVLKNSEEVSKEGLKQEAFNVILKNSISFAVIYKLTLQFYIANNDTDQNEDMKMTNNYLPMLHELFVYSNLGTLKLSNTIKKKIDQDLTSKSISEFEKYITVFLYADIKGPKYMDYVSALIRTSNSNYILDMAFFKIVTYYFFRSKDADTDKIYLNLIGDVFTKTRNGYNKSKIMEIYKKRKDNNERQMKIDFEQ